MFRGSVKGTGYPLHPPVSPSLPLPCVTVCHHISTGFCLTPTDIKRDVFSVFLVRDVPGFIQSFQGTSEILYFKNK
jgi:hypothetical protein